MREKEFLGNGFSFPLEADFISGSLKSAGEEESIRQAIYLILMTRKGERILHPDFGCGIWDYVFEVPDFPVLSRMEQEVTEALILWEPRITDLEVEVSPGEAAWQVNIMIHYRVRSTNNPFNLVYPFYLEEGMEEP